MFIMKKQIKVYSILPEGFDKKRRIPSGKGVYSKSEDFFFYAKNWSDSDTSKIK